MEFHGSSGGSEWIRSYREFVEAEAEGPGPAELFEQEDIDGQAESGKVLPTDVTGPHQMFSEHLNRIAAWHGVSVERVFSRDRDYTVVKVRKAVLKKCRYEMEIPIAQLARWIGMKENSARYLLNS